MKVIHTPGSRPIKAWVGTKEVYDEPDRETYTRPDIEDSALKQLKNLALLPFLHPHGIAVMPDVHMGIGASVGTVIATDKAIIPAAVGVDIGCGMNAVRLSLKASDLPDSLVNLRHDIERGIPLGPGGAHQKETTLIDNHAALPVVGNERLHKSLMGVTGRYAEKAASQLGSLGSGNHFIEICLDQEDRVWVMLHSGSRGIGNMIGRYFIEKAKKRMEQYFITLPDGDLAYFPEDTADFNEYVEAVQWAQDYALENRKQMMATVLRAMAHTLKATSFTTTDEAINCHHNYVAKENHFGRNVWVTRKGAIRAREGDLGIIPGSMGQRSYIVRGKGNLDSYCSCSHGAGRKMSRTQAVKSFTVEDLKDQTYGVECRKDSSVLDEIPGAYKDMDQVMANQADLVEVVHTLKAVLCIKGN